MVYTAKVRRMLSWFSEPRLIRTQASPNGVAMNLDRLTIKAAEALQAAERRASSAGHTDLSPLHLLAAFVGEGSPSARGADTGLVVPLLEKAGVSVARLRQVIESELRRLPRVSGGSLAMSRELREIFDVAEKHAERMKDQYTSTEHLLLALCEVKSDAREVLSRCGANKDAVLAALKDIRGSATVTSQNPEETYQALERYGRDLVATARQGKLDPVIGRDDEIRRCMQLLARRTKNNPVLAVQRKVAIQTRAGSFEVDAAS